MWPIVFLVVAVLWIVVSTTRWNLHPFLALLLAALGYGVACSGLPGSTLTVSKVVDAINAGFGETVGYIGLVILAGSVIGTFLEKSGGASSLAEGTLRVVGRRNVPAAMVAIGYLVSIPVFCDSAFVILAPLARALSRNAGIRLAASAIALSLGLYLTHTMVPPTPGPAAAAAILKADLGRVIFLGLVVSGVGLVAAWLFAVVMGSRVELPADADPPDAADDATEAGAESRPSPLGAVMPILLPIGLIILRSVSQLESHPLGTGQLQTVVDAVGQPLVALVIGIFLSLLSARRWDAEIVSTRGWVGEAVLAAAMIIVVTGCGGAFGKVLEASGIATSIRDLFGASNLSIWLPILLAAALKTAQGSSTVAMITTAGVVAPLLPAMGLDTANGRALVAIAIGAGSIALSHVNDSFYWIVVQMTGMNVKQGYQLQTFGSLVIATVAAATCWALTLIPL
jgi:GntP family gluconate:H+ symporter